MIKSKTDIAVEKFASGYSCAQSVFYPFCDDVHLDKNTALRITNGFGGGIGRNGEVCGAVSGGIMVLSAKYGRDENKDQVATDLTYAKTRELMARFTEKHGTYICLRLLSGCELVTEVGQKKFKESGLKNKVCIPCVQTVVEILEDIL